MESAQDEEVYRAIPKIELHAHLNGSLRDATVVDLLKAKRKRQGATDAGVEADLPAYLFQHNRSLEECFQVFGLIHKLTNSLDVIKRITREVLEDFAEENVKYIELFELSRASIECIFAPEHDKEALRQLWRESATTSLLG
ncbi:adal protein [Acanthamoeba castellanii str. Neff]|uniref:Adal protein n=1 Tax=Acanthamoeba castellanii (strain ATCC 30010 / Neff) TaxID=1257118 RepID=L8H6N9_ACACF|nr:adal protein [Acanthamoeba castellanii str. Neff]ELR21169.1 adal protein [Acanthamoeba castellanii str. Neff]